MESLSVSAPTLPVHIANSLKKYTFTLPSGHDIPPPAVVGVSSITMTSVTLVWPEPKVHNPCETSYIIEQCNVENEKNKWSVVSETGNTQYAICGLTSDTEYHFRVSAKTSRGVQGEPTPVSFCVKTMKPGKCNVILIVFPRVVLHRFW